MTLSPSRAGFTLVELSVVLVIVGMLVGGIMMGQSLVRSAELRSIVTQYNGYRSAVTAFQQKYRYFPGDLPNAVSYWPSAAGNGNGNGYVEYTGAAGAASEAFGFWQQLSMAGMIEGSYSGLSGTGNTQDYIPGVNSPNAKINGVIWGASYINNQGGAYPNIFQRNYSNWFSVGSTTVDTNYADSPFLKTEEAYSIDKKSDDGLPGAGSIQITYSANTFASPAPAGCSNAISVTDYAATYQLSNSADNQCGLVMQY